MRNPEALRRAHGYVGPLRAGRVEQGEGEQISDNRDQGAGFVRPAMIVARWSAIAPLDPGYARSAPNDVGEVEVGRFGDLHIDSERFTPGLDHGNRLGVAVVVDPEDRPIGRVPGVGTSSSLRRRRCPRREVRRWRSRGR